MSTAAAGAAPRVTAHVVFGLAAVLLLSYLDWITHRELVVTVILALLAGGAILYRREISDRLGLGPFFGQIPAWVRPILAAAPAVLYFLVRGQGTSGAGGVVLVAMVITIGVAAFMGPAIDARLTGFYASRNRVLPLPLRMALALVLPIVVAFLVIHGSLADLPALLGGTTTHPMSPTGREGLFLLGTLLSAAVAFLLMRESGARAAEGSTPGTAPAVAVTAAPAQAAAGPPTHRVPAEGMPAWAMPDPTAPVATMLEPGLPLQVVETAGEWARVVASNGWTGWVDGRRLERLGGS